MKQAIVFLLLVSGVMACSPKPYATADKVYKKQAKAYSELLRQYPLRDSGMQFVGTTNFTMRRPNFVIIHHTAQNSCEETLRTFTRKGSREVSAHYVICRSGTVYHMLNDLLRAHHGGVSRWGTLTDLNSSSIGIEIDNNGHEPFTEAQINSLLVLLNNLKTTYKIPESNFLGHADIAPGRKVDPSRFFPWKRLADAGFGYWYDTTAVAVKPDFDGLMALRTIGYNTARPADAIQSYKIHFNPSDTTRVLTATDDRIISSLLEKYK
ncbi:N-acetylmuramoyl-L-alanine amidase [Niabella terrae]